MNPPLAHFWAVIPAGGAGTRLWPVSRSSAPKFLLDLTGSGRSLLQQTHDRLQPLAQERFMVVTGRAHEAAVAGQLPELDPGCVLAEPSPRDSMAAIGLAAAMLELRDPDAVMGSFAADHVIADVPGSGFADTVAAAVSVALDDWLVTIGIRPTYAATGFGYVHVGTRLPDHPDAALVRQFVEKPSAEVASVYLAAGDYRWNAGMFVVRPRVLLDLLATWHPDFASTLRAIAAEPDRLGELWPTLPRIALDTAVAEPAADFGRVATVPAGFDWDDIGDFDSLASILTPEDPAGEPVVLGDAGLVTALAASGLVVPGSGRVVAVIGLEDVVVVDTPDAVLVTSRARAQEVKQVVQRLTESGRTDLT